MKCPVCTEHTLEEYLLEAGLPAYRCQTCEGVWVSGRQYWAWLRAHEDQPERQEAEEQPLPVEKATQAKLCPECGRFLRRYKVWPNVDFYLDRCSHCRSIWFDRDEWAVLKARGLHDDVHLFFMDIWQEDLRQEETRQRLDEIYRTRFGETDYARIREIRAWLEEHPLRSALLAFLTDRDPYSISAR